MGEPKKKSEPVLPWMRSPIDVSLFEECPLALLPCLDARLKEALQDMGFSSLFPVQVAVWQETIGPGGFERDLCVNSPTGSGKTLAYALPIVQMLSTRTVKSLRALVVLPTRDLALQVKEVFAAIAPAVGLSVGLAVGQTSLADEISGLIKRPKLEAGICFDPEDVSLELQSSVDILVATPGRLMDHINNTKGFTLEHLRYLVVDETDRLLREAYQSWLPTVLQITQSKDESLPFCAKSVLPSPFGSFRTIRRCGVERGFKGKAFPRLVKMVLSATLTQDPGKLAQLDLHHPLFLTTGPRRYQFPEKLESYKLVIRSRDILLAAVADLPDFHTAVPSSDFEALKGELEAEKKKLEAEKEKSRNLARQLEESEERQRASMDVEAHLTTRLSTTSCMLKQEQAERAKICEAKLKPLYLVALLQSLGGEKCIVFTSSVESTHRLSTLLHQFSDLQIKIKEYSGLQPQSVRSKTLKAFREGDIQVLVSSDAMTRGMDVEGVRNVINYDIPAYIKTYIHRAGRTARAGQTGRCITLLRKAEVNRFTKMLKKADNKSCPVYSVPSESIEALNPLYASALEKMKEIVESETSRKRKFSSRAMRTRKGKENNPSKE